MAEQRVLIDGGPPGRRPPPGSRRVWGRARKQPKRGEMNRNEQAYARYLDDLVSDGRVLEWLWEPMRLRLGNNCGYTPDFLRIAPDGEVQLVDVKGRKGDSFWAEPDAMIKLRTAASVFPFIFAVAWQGTDGVWRHEVIPC